MDGLKTALNSVRAFIGTYPYGSALAAVALAAFVLGAVIF